MHGKRFCGYKSSINSFEKPVVVATGVAPHIMLSRSGSGPPSLIEIDVKILIML